MVTKGERDLWLFQVFFLRILTLAPYLLKKLILYTELLLCCFKLAEARASEAVTAEQREKDMLDRMKKQSDEYSRSVTSLESSVEAWQNTTRETKEESVRMEKAHESWRERMDVKVQGLLKEVFTTTSKLEAQVQETTGVKERLQETRTELTNVKIENYATQMKLNAEISVLRDDKADLERQQVNVKRLSELLGKELLKRGRRRAKPATEWVRTGQWRSDVDDTLSALALLRELPEEVKQLKKAEDASEAMDAESEWRRAVDLLSRKDESMW